MKRKAPWSRGFTLVEIMIVVSVIGLLAAIAIPGLVRARKSSQTNACINNLRELDNAKQEWALEKGAPGNKTPADTDIQPYIGRGLGSLATMHCPLVIPGAPLAGYEVQPVSTPPICANYDAVEHPAELSGIH